jgi:CBS domain-containing protein
MYDDVMRRFLTIVIPNLLAEEIPPQHIFSAHGAWQNGVWESKDGGPRSAVALGFRHGRLHTAIEIETPRSLSSPLTPQRWKRFPSDAHLDLVVPKQLVAQSLAMAREVGVSVHDLWSYAVDPSKNVTITRKSSDPTELAKYTDAEGVSCSERRLETMRASNIMTPNPVTVRENTPVSDAARLLVQNWVSGLPVVDAEGRLVGIISERDLLFQHRTIRYVGDVMTRDLITAEESASIDDLATMLLEHCIKRVPILRGGQLVGIVSRHDLLLAQFADESATSEGSQPA